MAAQIFTRCYFFSERCVASADEKKKTACDEITVDVIITEEIKMAST